MRHREDRSAEQSCRREAVASRQHPDERCHRERAQPLPIRVSNLSAHGALVIGQAFPERDTPVVFRCNGFAVESWVAWVKAPHAGIQFAQPIRPEELLRNAAVPAPAIVRDTRKLDFRRPGFRGNQLTPEERDELQDWLASQANEPTERVKTNPAEQESGSVPLRG
jgi:hypothetical protein